MFKNKYYIMALIMTLLLLVIPYTWFTGNKQGDSNLVAKAKEGSSNKVEVPGRVFDWSRDSEFLKVGSKGSWDDAHVIPEDVIFVNGQYWCVYEGRNSKGEVGVGLVSSPDLKQWHKFSGNPVISGINDPSPHIIKENDLFYIFANDKTGKNITLYSSNDITGKYKFVGNVLLPGDTGNWDSYRVLEPFLFIENGIYYLYYMGDTSDKDPHEEQIGLAVASKISGPYTKVSKKPVLGFDKVGTWDDNLEADPWLFKNVDGYYYLGYAGGSKPGGEFSWKTGLSRSKSPYGPFERYPLNPILESRQYNSSDLNFKDYKSIWRGSMFTDGNGGFWIDYGGRNSAISTNGYLARLNDFPPKWITSDYSWEEININEKTDGLIKNGEWEVFKDAIPSGSYSIKSKNTNDYIILTFSGIGVRVHGRVDQLSGIAGLSIDEKQESKVDLFQQGTFTDGDIIFEETNLNKGVHTLKIRVTGDKNDLSKDKYVGIDFFEILK